MTIRREIFKTNGNMTIADYEAFYANAGSALQAGRVGELVIDLANTASPVLYISNAIGILNPVGGGGNGSPGGSNTSVQFNDGGTTFGGGTNLTFDKTSNTLTSNIVSVISKITTPNANVDLNLIPPANAEVFITASGVAGGVQIQGGNNILSLQQGTPEFEVRGDDINFSINSGTNGDVFFDLSAGGNSSFSIGTGNGSWVWDETGNLTASQGGSNNVNFSIDGNIISGSNVYIPNIPAASNTTANTPVVLIDTSANGNGVVTYNSLLYYDNVDEELHVGNLVINDNPVGTEIRSSQPVANGGYIYLSTVNGVSLTISPSQLVKYTPLTTVPPETLGGMYYNHDVANSVNGYYLARSSNPNNWDLIMTASNVGGIVQLPGQSSAPTAVAGGVYYDSTQEKFFMCANVSLGWQTVNLT